MLTKKIILGILVSLFSFGFSAAAIAEGYGTPNDALGDKNSSMTMENEGIEFDYSPMTARSGLASVSALNVDSEVIEFDYSPRENSNLASASSINKESEDIEFDYSPREDSKIIATLPSMKTDSENIQFDSSPRPVNCVAPNC